MSSDRVITVANVAKCYPMYAHPRDRLKQFVMPKVRRAIRASPRQYFQEFWALKDVSFELKKGETLGIVGRNGSGKSTLLQLICGTLSPTSGTIETAGRIAALLELGSGFNPDFTGRDNVYLNGAVLGLRKDEIDGFYDEIVDFADIGDFIDHPVKTYSSGMMVRLAFAVQAQVSPSILVVDEALAVGDAKFQAKCFERLKKLKDSGTSILLVTHSTEQIVTHCSQAILLEKGEIAHKGEPRQVVNHYLDLLFGKKSSNYSLGIKEGQSEQQPSQASTDVSSALSNGEDLYSTRPGYNPHEYRWGDGAAKIIDFCLLADGEFYRSGLDVGQKIDLAIAISFIETIVRPIIGVTIKTKEGVTVYGINSETHPLEGFDKISISGSFAIVRASFVCRLAAGDYFVSIGIASQQSEGVVPHDRRYDSIHLQVHPNTSFFGLVDLGLELCLEGVPS